MIIRIVQSKGRKDRHVICRSHVLNSQTGLPRSPLMSTLSNEATMDLAALNLGEIKQRFAVASRCFGVAKRSTDLGWMMTCRRRKSQRT